MSRATSHPLIHPEQFNWLLGPPEELKRRGILVVAPHPDDEILGCGALMAAAAAQGRPVWVMYLTDGGNSRPEQTVEARAALVLQRQQEAVTGLEILGLDPLKAIFIGAPDGDLAKAKSHIRLATFKLETLLESGSVSAIFVTSHKDNHPDHKAAYKLVISAVCGVRDVRLYTYPVSSRIDRPDADPVEMDVYDHFPIRIDTEGWRDLKRAALAAHASQIESTGLHSGFALSQQQLDLMCDGPEYFALDPTAYRPDFSRADFGPDAFEQLTAAATPQDRDLS